MKARLLRVGVCLAAALLLGARQARACDTSCAVQCSNGFWSSIACFSNECAVCSCSDPNPDIMANPHCDPAPSGGGGEGGGGGGGGGGMCLPGDTLTLVDCESDGYWDYIFCGDLDLDIGELCGGGGME